MNAIMKRSKSDCYVADQVLGSRRRSESALGSSAAAAAAPAGAECS